jgi:YD repeat-containing protein
MAVGSICWKAAPAGHLQRFDGRLAGLTYPSGRSLAYGFDALGNRLSKTIGANSEIYAYGATSNRIASLAPASGPLRNFQFDANGSTLDDAVNRYAYDSRGRLIQASTAQGATGYQVNALGQRVRKANSQADTVFHYDTRGRLIAESDSGGALKREYLYLNDLPVAVIQ